MRLLAHLVTSAEVSVCYPGRVTERKERVREAGVERIVETVDELLADPSVDAVVIATPPRTHASLARQALDAGKHTFVEKPLCLDLEDVGLLFDTARSANRVLFTGYSVSYHPVVQELARLARGGALQSFWSYRAKIGSFGSDVVSTHLVHELAVADDLLGRVSAWTVLERSGVRGDPDAVMLATSGPSGTGGVVRVDRVSLESRRELGAWISGRVFRWDGGPDLLERTDGAFRVVFSDPMSALERELGVFLDAVQAGTMGPTAVERERRLAELTVHVREAVLR
jgi:predicted dehydrogenase